jgi:hypothetical protein
MNIRIFLQDQRNRNENKKKYISPIAINSQIVEDEQKYHTFCKLSEKKLLKRIIKALHIWY